MKKKKIVVSVLAVVLVVAALSSFLLFGTCGAVEAVSYNTTNL